MLAAGPLDERSEPDDRFIGKLASTHCKPCSCYMCGNPRKLGYRTIQERRSEPIMED